MQGADSENILYRPDLVKYFKLLKNLVFQQELYFNRIFI